jgi:tetratricopeptide (TPR) repeat protein
MGGIGKTELAYLTANRLVDVFPDAQIVVQLRGTSANPTPVVQALRQAIHAFTPDAMLPDDLAALQAHYRSVLHRQRVLILADDAYDAQQVRALLPPIGCALLVTSRVRFSLPGMTTIDLEPLRQAEAVLLLRRICDRLELADARTIAQACGYLPLALRVSASILQDNPALCIGVYLQQLADERQRLRRLRDPDDAQLDVAAALALSYAQLDAATQRVFRQLGVLAASFDTPLAQAIVEPAPGVDVTNMLHHLLRRNLVMYNAQSARWRLHNLVRDLARHQLKAAGEQTAVMWRYARAALRIAQKMQEQYLAGGEAALAALTRFDIEGPHIDAARHWAIIRLETPEGDALLRDDALARLRLGELRYNMQAEWIPQLELALAATRRLHDRGSASRLLTTLGNAYVDLGDAGRALPYYTEALALAEAIGDRPDAGYALNNQGNAYADLGDTRRAIRSYTQWLAIVRETKNRRGEEVALCNLGLAYAELGHTEQAIAYYKQALIIAREVGDRRGEGATLCNLGLAYMDRSELRRAIAYFERDLAITQEVGDRRGEGATLGNLGKAYARLGQLQLALDFCMRALTRLREVGDRRQEGYVLDSLGEAYTGLGKLSQAADSFEQALAVFQEAGDRRGEAECSWHYGLLLVRLRERTRALPLLHTAVVYEQAIGHAKAAEHAALLADLQAGKDMPAELQALVQQSEVGEAHGSQR